MSFECELFVQTNLHFDYTDQFRNEWNVWLSLIIQITHIAVNRMCCIFFCSHSDLLLAKRRKNLPNWIKKNSVFSPLLCDFPYVNCVYIWLFCFWFTFKQFNVLHNLAGNSKMWFIDYCYYDCYSCSCCFSLTMRMCENLCMRISERILCVETIFRWIWN